MFEGPWIVIEADTLEKKSMPAPGEIIKHRSGAVILCCPKCNSMQFAHSPIVGPVKVPTLMKRILCGSGHCNRCATIFSIDAGRTVIHEAMPEPKKTPIPEKLRKAGLKSPPKLPEEFR